MYKRQAVDEQAALDALDTFGEHWDRKYPKISRSWRDNWANLSTYFKYPQEVRRLIYTTNAIEGFNRQLRKVTKAKSVFPTDDSLLKMLYLAMMDITKKWTGRRQDWSVIHAQMAEMCIRDSHQPVQLLVQLVSFRLQKLIFRTGNGHHFRVACDNIHFIFHILIITQNPLKHQHFKGFRGK